SLLAVDRNLEIELSGFGDLVGGDKPRPEDRVGINRFAEAAILGPADRDVEADRVSRDVPERIGGRDLARRLDDEDRELHVMIGPAIRLAVDNYLAGVYQRAVRLEAYTGRVN